MEKKEILKILLALVALAVISFWSIEKPKVGGEFAKKEEEKTVSKEPLLEWKELTASAPWEPRDSHETFVFKNKIWLIGGFYGNGRGYEKHFIAYWTAPHFNDIWNTEDSINWTKIESENIWTPRRSMSIVFFKDKLWMFGGWSKAGGYINDIWYSDDGINWMEATDGAPWAPRWDHALAVHNEKFYLMAGMDLMGKLYNDVWSSSDGANWMLETDSPQWQARQGASAVNFGGKLWLLGRLDDYEYGGTNDAWYSEDGKNWEKAGAELPWDGREDFTTVIFRDKIYIMGGMAQDINFV